MDRLKSGSKYILCRNYNLEWGKTTFQLLGIQFSINLKDITNNNMVPKIIKIKNILKQWKKRNLTPIGKITVLKTLVLSKLNHIFISLPTPSEQKLKEIEKYFFPLYGMTNQIESKESKS